MRRFNRVLSLLEKQAIEEGRRIDTNLEEWFIYEPKTVVFLFDLAIADPKHIKSVADSHFEDKGETWILSFEAELETEPNLSQSGWKGAVVHKGPIEVSRLGMIRWVKHQYRL